MSYRIGDDITLDEGQFLSREDTQEVNKKRKKKQGKTICKSVLEIRWDIDIRGYKNAKMAHTLFNV